MVAPGRTVNSFTNGARHMSKRLLASYIVDWILILGVAALGGGFNRIEGARHAFSLSDPSISFPYHADTVSVAVLIIVSVVAPGVITAIISLLFVPGPTANKNTPKALIWRRKIWEWNTAWMGLGIALAGAFMITEGLKDVAGRPRPHMLALCDPDLSPESIARWQVGGLGVDIESAVPIIVDWHICRRANDDAMHNAFASWPSGHASFAWAGMLYLTLFISAKFAIQLPFLPPSSYNSRKFISTFDEEEEYPSKSAISPSSPSSETTRELTIVIPPRNEAAAPPVYLLIIAFVPIGVAFFIAISRWFDYRHHAFDIICGSLIGIFTAWFGFRWYHLPIRQGSGWSWGARSRERAFWLGVGVPTYVGDEGWESKSYADAKQFVRKRQHDLEQGDRGINDVVMGGGMRDNPAKKTANAGKLTKSRGMNEDGRSKDSASRVDSDETQ